MHFVRRFSIGLCVRKAYCNRRGSNFGKIVLSKTLLEKTGGKDTYTSHPSPLDPPMAISYKNHQKGLAYFSHWHHVFSFTKRESQKGGHGTMPP